MDNCKAIRERLRRPPNAVPDTGIDLRRGRATAAPPQTEPEQSIQPLLDWPKIIPFRRTDLTFSNTLAFISAEFNITPQDIRKHKRTRDVSTPRQIAIWLTYRNKVNSLAGMGKYLDMDHTTMIHARNKVQEWFDGSSLFRQYILPLEARLLANFNRTPIPAEHQS